MHACAGTPLHSNHIRGFPAYTLPACCAKGDQVQLKGVVLLSTTYYSMMKQNSHIAALASGFGPAPGQERGITLSLTDRFKTKVVDEGPVVLPGDDWVTTG